MSPTPKSTFTTHTHVLHKPALGLWVGAQDSEAPRIHQELLCTKQVHGATPYSQLLGVPRLYLLSLLPHKDTRTGFEKVTCSPRRKGRAVHTPLCLDKDAPRPLKTGFSLAVVAILQFWIRNLNYSSAPKVHAQMLSKQQKQVQRTHSRNPL